MWVSELSTKYMCWVNIDLFHNGDQIWYSFVLMLINLKSLAAMGKIQKNTQTKVKPVGLINIYTKDWQNKPPFIKEVYKLPFLCIYGIRFQKVPTLAVWQGNPLQAWIFQVFVHCCLNNALI